MRNNRLYDADPKNPDEFTRSFDRAYSRFALRYDVAVKYLPVWKTWLRCALPHIRGPHVLEVSFGTGYLLTQYAHRFETHGIDYNAAMVRTARQNLARVGRVAHLCRSRVEALPYADQSFDTVVNTMAFSGYPDSPQALAEMRRVLRPSGRVVLIDVNYPADGNWIGTKLTDWAKRSGDLIRDLGSLFHDFDFVVTDNAIGGYGSVHLYIAEKAGDAVAPAGSSNGAQRCTFFSAHTPRSHVRIAP